MTDRVNLERLAGFSTLSSQAQQWVRQLIDEDRAAPRGGGLDAASARAAGLVDRVDDADARLEAVRFVRSHALVVAAHPETPRQPPGRRTAGAAVVPSVEQQLKRLSIREKAALVVMEYGHWSYAPKSGGIIVSSPHLTSLTAPQLARMIDGEESRRGMPLLVAADQEGGRVNRLRNLPGFQGDAFAAPGTMQGMTREQIREEGHRVGLGLAAAKVNLLLGPVLDVARPDTLMARQGRSFGADPVEVTSRAQAYVDGLREANPNLAIVAKHFPGYDVGGNSDNTPVVDDSSLDLIERRLAPFFDVDGLDGVMLSSITYAALDDQPACFSPKVVAMLRARHPEAVVMTDDLHARGLLSEEIRHFLRHREIRSNGRPTGAERAELGTLEAREPRLRDEGYRREMSQRLSGELMDNAQRAFDAGADLLLIMDAGAARWVQQRVEELATSSPERAAALDQKVRRLLLLRERLRSNSPLGRNLV